MVERHDIILLVLDTQRADRLSCYGYQQTTSPHLDRLAARATRFAAPIAPAQWTVPTHASLFTGLYPSQHTVHQMNSVLPAGLPTLAQRLAAEGYYTVGFSQNPLIGLVKNDLDRGFEHFESHHLLSNILLTTRLNRPTTDITVRKRLERAARWVLAEALGYSYETPLQHLAPVLAPLWQRLLQAQGRSKIASTSNLLRAAARLLTEREGCTPRQPIFLFINLMGAHVPYDPDRDILRRFLPTSHDIRQTSGLLRWANQLQIDVQNWLDAPLMLPQQQILNAIYDAEVATQDGQVGRFLQELEDDGRLEHTFLAVVADHGDHLGEKDRVNHGFGVYQPLVHVPLIVHDPWQRLDAGDVRPDPVSTRRLFHTLLQAGGAATDEEAALSLMQRSIPVGEEAVVSEGFPLEWAVGRLDGEKARYAQAHGHTRTLRAMRRDDLKLLEGQGGRELYNLYIDPAETENLLPAMSDEAEEMARQLAHFRRETHPVAEAMTREEDDADVIKQLRELGYLE